VDEKNGWLKIRLSKEDRYKGEEKPRKRGRDNRQKGNDSSSSRRDSPRVHRPRKKAKRIGEKHVTKKTFQKMKTPKRKNERGTPGRERRNGHKLILVLSLRILQLISQAADGGGVRKTKRTRTDRVCWRGALGEMEKEVNTVVKRKM